MKKKEKKPKDILINTNKNNRFVAMFNCLQNDYEFDKVKNTISDLCIADFVKKSLTILSSSVIVPCSIYTYDIFKNMFCFFQRGDCTTKDESETFLITDVDKIVDLIVDGLISDMPGLKEERNKLNKEVRRMYGPGEFPFLNVRAIHDKDAWWFSYSITR